MSVMEGTGLVSQVKSCAHSFAPHNRCQVTLVSERQVTCLSGEAQCLLCLL